MGGISHSHNRFAGGNLINLSTTKWKENSPDVVDEDAAAADDDDGMELNYKPMHAHQFTHELTKAKCAEGICM